jgi:hypothetical protein
MSSVLVDQKTSNPSTKCDARGSPRLFNAASILFTGSATIKMDDAMKLAGCTKHEISC